MIETDTISRIADALREILDRLDDEGEAMAAIKVAEAIDSLADVRRHDPIH